MGQFNYRNKDRKPGQTPSEWLRVSAAVGRVVNSWAGRTDIAAYAGPDAGEGHPAMFNPKSSEIEINVNVCFAPNVDPSEIEKIDERETQFEWPRATGAIFHEACHAKYSLWNLEEAARDLTAAEFEALVLLEEGRIEKHGIDYMPGNAGFLRTMSLNIVIDDLENVLSGSDTAAAGSVAALALARVDAGSLKPEDVAPIEKLIESKIGAERLAKLREIWIEAQAYNNHAFASGMYPLAKRWLKILDEAAEENGDARPSETLGGSSASAIAGLSKDEMSEFIAKVVDALSEAAEGAEIAANMDLWDTQTQEEWQEQVKSKADNAKTKRDAENVASEVFGVGSTEVNDSTATTSRLLEERAPTSHERAAAVKIAQLLEKAKYRDRSETEISSVVPPGRLRTRAAVQGAALRSKGIMTPVEPWRRTVRKHTDDPVLNIGVMVDISGSMNDAMSPMATTAWVLSEAVRRIQGRAAMVYYGQSVFPTLKPGQHLDRVATYSATDATEKFDRAFKALNGGLNLLGGSGARLLVVFSDGEYVNNESAAARRWLTACQAAGVGVLWLGCTTSANFGAKSITRGTSAVFAEVSSDTVAAATVIGQAAAKALTAVA